MTERISNKVIGYLKKYPEFLTGVHSDTEAGNLFAGYYNLRQEPRANPQLEESLSWQSLKMTAQRRIQETFDDIFPPSSSHLRLDPEFRQVTIDGKPKSLSLSEFVTLSILSEHPGQVVNHQDLARKLEERLHPQNQGHFARELPTSHIRSLIQRLRRALGDDAKSPVYIATVMGIGYSLIIPFPESPL